MSHAKDYVLMAAVACLFRQVEFVHGVYLAERSVNVWITNLHMQILLLE